MGGRNGNFFVFKQYGPHSVRLFFVLDTWDQLEIWSHVAKSYKAMAPMHTCSRVHGV